MATIQGVYVALFGRPADPIGLSYWKGVTNDGKDLSKIMDLAASKEYQDRFVGQSNTQIVNSIYLSLFGHDADLAGLTFWVNGLNSGQFKINDIAIRILDGAQGTDKTTAELKIAAADKFTAQLDTTQEIIAYDGNDAAAQGRAFLASVTTTAPTDAQVAAAVQAVVDDYQGPINATFTLTTGNDFADVSGSFKNGGAITSDFKFTAGNEKISAPAGTLKSDDILIDNSTADNDVLDAQLTTNVAVAATITNIETINLSFLNAGADFQMTNVTGTTGLSVTGVTNGAITGLDLTKGTTLDINEYTKELALTVADLSGTKDKAEKLSVAVNNSKATLDLQTTVAGNLETLELISAGTAANTLNLKAGSAAIDKIVVTGKADLTVGAEAAAISGKEIDASAEGGKVILAITTGGAPTSAANFKGIDGYVLSGAAGSKASLNNIASGSTVQLANTYSAAAAITVKGAAASETDAVTLSLKSTATTATDVAISDLTVSDVETINLVSDNAKDGNSIKLTAASATTVNVTGASKLDLDLDGFSGKNLTVDASAATGKVNLDVSAFQGTNGGAVEIATITGNAADNVITLGVGTHGKYVVNAGEGKDTIIVADSSTATITTGAGSDTIKLEVTSTNVTNLSITDFTAGAGGDVFSTKGVVAGVVFDNDSNDVDNGETFVYTAAGLDGVTGATLDAAGFTGLGNNETALFVALNNNTGYAEVYAITGSGADTDFSNDTVVKIATFENITTLTGLGALTADNFAVY